MVVGELTVETELVVIGGGPGGYAAALRARELGIETTLVDARPALGGTWLHEGCVLSKELLYLAETIRAAAHAERFGIRFGPPQIDLPCVRASLSSTVDRLARDMVAQCQSLGVTRVQGTARFDDSRQLSIADNPAVPRIRFRRAIIATGVNHVAHDAIDTSSPRVMEPADALQLPAIPPTLLVVGASTISLELASVYAALGSRVTIVDTRARLLSHADEDLAAALLEALEDTLEDIRLQTTVRSVTDTGDHLEVELEGPGGVETSRFDFALVALTRRADLDALQLSRTDVQVNERGFVDVNEQLQTTDARIFAVGDVTGEPLLTQRASHQGRIAAEVIAGWGSYFDARAVPMVLFTDPQVAWCGLTEDQARKQGQACSIQRTQWAAAGRTAHLHRSGGFTKIVYDPDTKIVLGVGSIGANAAELIAEGALAVEMGAALSDLASTIHPHPTQSESLGRAAEERPEADVETSA